MSFKNCLPIFVFTLSYDGLNHIIFSVPVLSVCCSLKFKATLKSLSFKAF